MSFAWSKRTGIPKEELKSLINLVFCSCRKKYRPGRGEFINYFKSTTRKVVKETIDLSKNTPITEVPLDSIQLKSMTALPDSVLIFKNTVENLSNDARFVVSSILSGSKTIDELSYIVGKTTRGIIRTFLRQDLKWSHKKIDKTFYEIEGALWDI